METVGSLLNENFCLNCSSKQMQTEYFKVNWTEEF